MAFRMSLRHRSERIGRWLEAQGKHVYPISELHEIHAALAELTHTGCTRLVVAGGDGTLQGIVTWLARHVAHANLPELVVLGGGRTNFVARDLGTRDRFLTTLAAALQPGHQDLHVESRHTLRLRHPSIGEQHAFFVAGAQVDHAIRRVHAWRATRSGWRGNGRFGTQFGLAHLAVMNLLGKDRHMARRMQISATPLGAVDGPCRLLVLSSLPHDRGLFDPYARRGTGPIRLTAVLADARAYWRNLPRLALGRLPARLEPAQGYLSGRCHRVSIRGVGQLSIDGQETDLDIGEALEVDAGPVFRFLRP